MKIKDLFLVLTLVLFILSCNSAVKYPVKLTIVYSSDLEGNLIPTGCGKVYYGGLPRRGTVVKQILKEDPDAIILDAGSPFYSRDMFYSWPDSSINRWLDYGKLMADGMKKTHTQLGCLGNTDLFNGFKNLTEVSKKAGYPILSLNLIDKTTSKPYFAPYRIIDHKGLRIAVIGITNNEERLQTIVTVMARDKDKDSTLQNLVLKDPIPLLQETIPKLKKEGVRFIIVLSSLGSMQDIIVAQQVPDINILIGSGMGIEYLQSIRVKETNTILLRSGGSGKFLGKIVFTFDGSDKPYADSKKYKELTDDRKYFTEEKKDDKLSEINEELSFYEDNTGKLKVQLFNNELIYLGKVIPDDPEMVNLLPEVLKGMNMDCGGLKKDEKTENKKDENTKD